MFFFLIVLLLPLLHNGCFILTCSAKNTPLDITTDTSSLIAFRDHLLRSSSINNILRTNWTSASNTTSSSVVCLWVGVTCSARHQRVVALHLGDMGLTGTISSHLGNLSFLSFLDISNNKFHGQLPEEIAHLRRLSFINVGFNSLSGNLPSWFGSLLQLKYIYLQNNNFEGPIPPSLSNCSKLEVFNSSFNQLSGMIHEQIGNLRNLRSLVMVGNQLRGEIPRSVFNISSLEFLSLARNKFSGHIPNDMCTSFSKLWFISLSYNGLEGRIPSSLQFCSRLEMSSFARNKFHGSIPSAFGNLTMLKGLYLGYNNLEGQVPEPIGRLDKLESLSLAMNNLGGHVPVNFFNITSLILLSFAGNHLTGHVPATIGFGLPNLEELYLGLNQFRGTIPDSISNSSRLAVLDLGYNKFTGSPPSMLGNLRLLQFLRIGENNLILNGTMFIASLNNCMYLSRLNIVSNQVNGPLPSSFGNLTSSLESLEASSCGIKGKIPDDIRNMSKLEVFDLSTNQLVGSLPQLQALSNIEQFGASDNNLGGPFPDDICHLPRLGSLDLQINKISGSLPNCLGNITSLRYLYLRINEMSGSIPVSLWDLKDILELDLSSNSFSGHLPQDIGTLRAAIYINLSLNQLSGTLPSAIGSLQTLANFSLAHNKFEGSIPKSFGKLLSMVELDLSYNNLSGQIPNSLQELSHMKILNVSVNLLSGEIPSRGPFQNLTYLSFESNQALCGSPRFHVQQCRNDGSSEHHTRRRTIPLFVLVFAGLISLTLVVIAVQYVILKCIKKRQVPFLEDVHPAVVHERISYYELQRATNSFDESNLLGMGSFGSVYKGVSSDGRVWAVKVFKFQVGRAIRSFDTECEILRNIRHRNLTKVISSCVNLDFMALVLEYMPNGSLDKWLYSHNYLLDVKQRLDIMIDVASALDYLHHGYSVPIAHCDLKPSNVLLDEDMVAHVSDFGISKLLKEEGNIEQTNTLATIGYTAPEYGQEGLVSTKCDVYSFGIMLMEVFTRRRPTEEMFDGDLDLKLWVKQSLPDRVIEVIDGNLVRQEEHEVSANVQCVSVILELACNCCYDSPEDRMIMKDVLAMLKKIKLGFLTNVT